MSGLPGSGKSTYIKSLPEPKVICSADHFFIQDGVYKFDITQLSRAHLYCRHKFARCLEEKVELIVVDNTNTTQSEVRDYYFPAFEACYEVELITVIADPKVCIARNVHSVPADVIEKMALKLKARKLPSHWQIKETVHDQC